jgi:hypothetical protein
LFATRTLPNQYVALRKNLLGGPIHAKEQPFRCRLRDAQPSLETLDRGRPAELGRHERTAPELPPTSGEVDPSALPEADLAFVLDDGIGIEWPLRCPCPDRVGQLADAI